jgi:hypothetical protein
MRRTHISHRFVEFIPDVVDEGILFISMEYATAIHKCCCGCGTEVVTPFTPTDWKLIFDGKSVSLFPSIGNSGFACESHYFIEKNRIDWKRPWSEAEIELGRRHDAIAKDVYFTRKAQSSKESEVHAEAGGLRKRFRAWLEGLIEK